MKFFTIFGVIDILLAYYCTCYGGLLLCCHTAHLVFFC